MKHKKYILVLILIFLMIGISNHSGQAQVLISLLLGDKLNSGKIEFGLDGGLNFSHMSNSTGNWKRGINLGFYFYFKMNDNSWIHTGVLVKSPFGTRNLPTYPTGDEDVDTLMLNDGYIDRNLRYFNVPVTYCHYIYKPFFLEGGIMLGLRSKAWDEFLSSSSVGDEISVKLDIKDQVKALDAGLIAGAGYKFQKGLGIAVGVRYYYGLLNAHTDVYGVKHKNSNLYLFITIPIGKGRAEKKRLEKELQGGND
jgi:hypothetical protein